MCICIKLVSYEGIINSSVVEGLNLDRVADGNIREKLKSKKWKDKEMDMTANDKREWFLKGIATAHQGLRQSKR